MKIERWQVTLFATFLLLPMSLQSRSTALCIQPVTMKARRKIGTTNLRLMYQIYSPAFQVASTIMPYINKHLQSTLTPLYQMA